MQRKLSPYTSFGTRHRMTDHTTYMADFMTVFSTLERWGPGNDADTLRALQQVPGKPQRIADIGCGKGFASLLLAQYTQAHITAIDTEPGALARLEQKVADLGLCQRVTTCCASMDALPFEPGSFDLIWAEGSAYIMGIEAALKAWRPLLSAQGTLVFSDMVWLSEQASAEARAFWQREYPDMQTVPTRLTQIAALGYQVLTHFTLSDAGWDNYYQPLKARIEELRDVMPDSEALRDIAREVALAEQAKGVFGYAVFVLGRL